MRSLMQTNDLNIHKNQCIGWWIDKLMYLLFTKGQLEIFPSFKQATILLPEIKFN